MNPDFDPYQALVDLSEGQLCQSELTRSLSTHVKTQAEVINRLIERQNHLQLRVDIMEKMIVDMLDAVKKTPQ